MLARRAAQRCTLLRAVAVRPVCASAAGAQSGLQDSADERVLWVKSGLQCPRQPIYRRHEADTLVAEVNQGGEMVLAVIRQVDASVPLKTVHATRGK